MKTLLLIPSVLKAGIEEDVRTDRHPRMDYYALAAALGEQPGSVVSLLDYGAVDQTPGFAVRFTCRIAGRDRALALLGFTQRKQFDTIFTNGENVGIPLALLLKLVRKRPGHVTIGHRLSASKKRPFFTLLKAHHQMDTIFVYARSQFEYALRALRIPDRAMKLIPFHADTQFYRPSNSIAVKPDQICSAGLEWRDYPTLIAAVTAMPEWNVKLAAASPWSKHRNETADRTLPPNVEARPYRYGELRELYAQSSFVVVPLYENDFQAGVTTILEAMAMGKAVIATRTTGQRDVIQDEINGLSVPPGDSAAWRAMLLRLQADEELRERLGRSARAWVEEHASLELWVSQVVNALRQSCGASASPG